MSSFTVVSCGSLSNPANGQVLTTDTVYQSTAIYSCDTGYTLSGDRIRTCQDNGEWSGVDPDCNCELGATGLASSSWRVLILAIIRFYIDSMCFVD